MRIALLAAVLLLLPGCHALDLKKYDPETVLQINKTLEHERFSAEQVLKALRSLNAPDIVIRSVETSSTGEVMRLLYWLSYEEAKNLESKK